MTDSKCWEIIIGDQDSGRRLDAVLARHITGCSRRKIQESILKSKISIDGVICTDCSAKLAQGQKITAEIALARPPKLIPSDREIKIIFEDQDLLVINKPPGLVVHPPEHGKPQETLMASMMERGIKLSDILGGWRRGVVHRLDKETSGLMLMAKSNNAHQSLAAQIKARSVSRRYIALVWSIPMPPSGQINQPIAKGKLHYKRMVISQSGKAAVTHYELQKILFSGSMSLVECKLETGRTHQIRLHMSHIGCCVVGDKLYGFDERYLKSLPQDVRDKVIYLKDKPYHCLHSHNIEFDHPSTGERLKFDCNPPYFFQNIIELEK